MKEGETKRSDPCPKCGSSNTVVYDRYIYANQKSRTHGLGDPIRGDLPIVPCGSGWFNMSCEDCKHSSIETETI
jgi:hypothetical protein